MSRTKRWAFTVHNYQTVDVPNSIDELYEYLIFGEEETKEGGPHLQGYVVWKERKRISQIKKLLDTSEWQGAHWEAARGTSADNYKYCTKGGTYHEFGTQPEKDGSELHAQSVDWAQVWDLASQGGAAAVRGVYPEAAVRQFGQLEAIRAAALNAQLKPDLSTLSRVCGVWVYGKPGTGKTTLVDFVTNIENIFFRKWNDANNGHTWGTYKNEAVVLYDDVDPSLGTYSWARNDMKQVAHQTRFTIAGKWEKARMIRPKLVIVTSQYKISEVFQDQETRDALDRRFAMISVSPERKYTFVSHKPDGEDLRTVHEASTREEMASFLRARYLETVAETSSSSSGAKRSRVEEGLECVCGECELCGEKE